MTTRGESGGSDVPGAVAEAGLRRTGRRRVLIGGAALLGSVAVGATLGCSDDGDGGGGDETGPAGAGSDRAATTTSAGGATTPPADRAAGLTATDFAGLTPCLLTPEQTEGPYYLDADLERRDITEGRAGHPLRLGLQVVDVDCRPVAGATVDVWHADAAGDYSAFADGSSAGESGAGTTFLRGTQVAGDDGIVEFATVYPGWYPGRAVHVHVKAHVGGATVLTSQLYFPEDLTDDVHAAPAYAGRGPRDTRNGSDAIAGDVEAAGNLVTATPAVDGTLGLVVLGVDPARA